MKYQYELVTANLLALSCLTEEGSLQLFTEKHLFTWRNAYQTFHQVC